ncbi:hypothetical protein RIB2604_01708900 [Aspergillus luchuensis]|uniref:Uncharacterized protein n=1 Tax=Aspergillus kawachii TaxID=1069201 RepID=A0A146FEF1_ASPKA|nr:hypothetical protein RIB2604_01708900 [Aspergillus luchuensis]
MPSKAFVFCYTAYSLVTVPARLVVTTIQKVWPKPLEAGSLGDRFIVLHPQKTITTKTEEGQEQQTQSEVYKGITCSVPGVEPLPIGAVWFPEAPAKPPQHSD